MTLQQDLENAVTRVTQDSQTLHAIVHGDEQTVVSTEGGDVSSPAKVIFDIEQRIGQQLTDLNVTLDALRDAVANAQQSATDAEQQAQTATAAVSQVNLPTELIGHSGKLLAVNETEDGYTLTQSSNTVYGLYTEGAKLFVQMGEDRVMPDTLAGYFIAPVGITIDIDTRGHLLLTV